MISFIIPGEPKGKGRPRMSTKTGRAFTPKDTLLYENLVKSRYWSCIGEKKLEGEIRAFITCYYKIPKSTSKTKRELMLHDKLRPTKKPDLDNIAKVVLDSLNGIAFNDDAQVVELIIKKYYGEQPLVKVELEEIRNERI